MNVSSVTTFGSAAIASPPATNSPTVDDKPEAAPAQQPVEAAKPEGTGQFVDIKV